MKAGWQIKEVGGLCDVLDSKRKPVTKRDRVGGQYPYYGATGILDHVESYIFDEKLILIGEDGAKWGAGENTAFSAEGKYWVNNHAHVIRPHRQTVLDNWLIYFLNHSDLSEYVTGLTVPKLNQAKLCEIRVPVAPLPEQHRIVAILDEAFAGIATATANAERNLKNAREVFDTHVQRYFFGNESGWEEKRLADVVSELVTGPFGSMLHKSDYVRNGIPVVNPQNIIGGQIVSLDKTMVSEKTKSRMEKFSLRERDIVIARRGEMGRCATVNKTQVGWLCGTGSMIIRLKPTASERYIVQLLQSSTVRKNLEGNSVGATMNNLNQDILLGLKFHLPPIAEQCRIITTLEQLSTETQCLEAIYHQKLSKLNELKQSILHQAFSGQLH